MSLTELFVIPAAAACGFLATSFFFYSMFQGMPLLGNKECNVWVLLKSDSVDEKITDFMTEKQTTRFHFVKEFYLAGHWAVLSLCTVLLILFLKQLLLEGTLHELVPPYLVGVLLFIVAWFLHLRKRPEL